MSKILISTGALIGRPNGRDYRLLKPLSEQLICDGYEFMMYSTWYDRVEEIVSFLRENNINTPAFHCQKSIGESISKGDVDNLKDAFEKFAVNVKMAQKIGSEKMVLHLWDGVTSDAHIENNIEAFGGLRDIAGEHEIDLCVENVVCNVNTPFVHWVQLAERYPDIHFIFDTKMAAFHGQLELLYQKEYEWLWKEGHIKHFHINDYGGGVMDWANLKTLPIGKGHIDFDKFFAFVKRISYDDTFTIESTAFDSTGKVDVEMLNSQVEFIRTKQ